MKYTLVSNKGEILRSEEFGKANPPKLHFNKGRWLPDVKPVINENIQVVQPVLPVPATSSKIEYRVVNKPRDLIVRFKKSEINSWIDYKLSKFSWNGSIWDSDELSVNKINFYGLSKTAPACGFWTSADNKDIPVTGEDMANMLAALMAHQDTVHRKQRELKNKLDKLTDQQLVDLNVEAFLNG